MSSPRRFTPEDKLRLVLGSLSAGNVQAFCRENGVDRTCIYAWRRELETAALDAWRQRHRGRPRKLPQPQLSDNRDIALLWADLARKLADREGLAPFLLEQK